MSLLEQGERYGMVWYSWGGRLQGKVSSHSQKISQWMIGTNYIKNVLQEYVILLAPIV